MSRWDLESTGLEGPKIRGSWKYGKILVLILVVLLVLRGYQIFTERGPVEVHDWYDLDDVRNDLSDDYILMNDLDENTSGYDELVNTEDGWDPIGEYLFTAVEPPFITEPFEGTFDGNGHTIRDLKIDRKNLDSVGLFSLVGGEIKDVEIIDAEVIGGPVVGGLAASNGGTIENSYFTGCVSGDRQIGGLVGTNSGVIRDSHAIGYMEGDRRMGSLVGRNNKRIENSSANGDVSGERTLGGLVGSNWVNGVVKNSYSTGDVDGNTTVGGLVGGNWGTVSDSYATGEVSGEENVAGLVGYNSDMVSNSYATGNVSGNSNVGGFVGENDEGKVQNSFWDVNTTYQDDSDGGTGKTTVEMKDVATFTNTTADGLNEPWDFVENPYDDEGNEDIWDIDKNINDGYPFLSWKRS